jgi:hypothetical protein
MTVKYENGMIEFDLLDVLSSVSDETRVAMFERLSCDEVVIRHVAAQVIDKWTENGLSGWSLADAEHDPERGLDWAWREVARRSGDVARREIERLEETVKNQRRRIKDLEVKVMRLTHLGGK